MGDSKLTTRRTRAVGTRDRVLSHLAQTGEIRDESGMASAVLARQIGYPGSSIAFAQLLSGMERAGLIRREVRGKRTYRIRLVTGQPPSPGKPRAAPPAAAGPAATGQRVSNGTGSGPPTATGDLAGFDYDELARRLLVLLVRRLTAAPGQEETVAGLEQELASVRTMQDTLIAENTRLREQLREARGRLALARQSRARPPVTEQLDGDEISLLDRLLSSDTPDG
ncbi:MAG TPA: hypothetical protein VGS62_10750 [Streptosporangiaceae bacterium]|nr:hypothetical protein [Streptosporangiaceae bacterium]